jgi:vacuolar-type H+-ATPase subunit H
MAANLNDRRHPMMRSLLSVAVISTLLFAGIADAQQVKPKKLYRWVDREGKVQFSDTLPPEAVEHARTEISSQSGLATATVERALTPEERAAQDIIDAALAKANQEAEQVRQTEEAMIASFQTEADLKRSFQVRTSLLQQTLDAIEAGIASQRASLAALLSDASDAELAGKPVNVRQASTIRELHAEMAKQQQMLVLKQGELVDLDQELLHLINRFREIKGLGDAPAESGTPTG